MIYGESISIPGMTIKAFKQDLAGVKSDRSRSLSLYASPLAPLWWKKVCNRGVFFFFLWGGFFLPSDKTWRGDYNIHMSQLSY